MLGPAFLWMVSAAGSGELLFTPRAGAQYAYALLWAMLAAVTLKWFINHEVGRYAVCTGAPVLDGFARLPRGGPVAVALIVVPQLVVAVATVAGLAAAAATALVLIVPGPAFAWTLVLLAAATALTTWGRFGVIEKVATFIGIALALAAVGAAASVLRDPGPVAQGLVPRLPPQVDFGEVLPWLGFMLAGAAGMIWYSYWLSAAGYGAAGAMRAPGESGPLATRALGGDDRRRLRGWMKLLTLNNTLAVVGTLIPTFGFLVLGAELLHPRGLVPEEERVADVLGTLLGEVWGTFGYWFMVGGVLLGFSGTLVSVQDGFGRMLSHGARLLAPALAGHERAVRRTTIIGLCGVAPALLFAWLGEPVTLLKIAGAIEASHIPLLAGLVLLLNRTALPRELRPSRFVVGGTLVATAFFALFALVYLAQLMGLLAE